MYYYRNRKQSQLNAISYSVTKRNNEKADRFLSDLGIDYETYCKDYGWKASAVRLETKVWDLLKKLYGEMGVRIWKSSDQERIISDVENGYLTYWILNNNKKELPCFWYLDNHVSIAIDFSGKIYNDNKNELEGIAYH